MFWNFFYFNRKFFSFDIHILLCLYFFWKLFCLLGNSFILQHWVNYYISLGNSFILIQYESKIILLCIYFFWRLFTSSGNSFILNKLFYSHCYFLNLWPATFWTQIQQSCHCEIVKVKIVGQVTCHFGFASADNFLMEF